MRFWVSVFPGLILVLFIVVACSSDSGDSDASAESLGEVIVTQGDLRGTPADICAAVTPTDPATRQYSEPQQVLMPDIDYRAIFCTDVGAVYVDLYETVTPITVNSFVFLAERGYYNDTTFHRVLADFMAQGGDPTGTGSGTPGYRFEDEFAGFLHFDRPGLLAMANTGQPITNGSQFFITTSLPTGLNYQHSIFGEVITGQDVVNNLRLRDPQQNPSFDGSPLETVIIITDGEAVDAAFEPPSRPDLDDIIAAFADGPTIPGLESFEVMQAGELDLSTIDGLAADQLTEEDGYLLGTQLVHRSSTCDTSQIAFVETGVKLLTFASSADAEAALNGDTLFAIATFDNDPNATYSEMNSDALSQPVYVADSRVCDVDIVRGASYWQVGRYIVIANVAVVEDQRDSIDLWLRQVVGWRVYENMFTDLLRPEIWHG